MSVSQNFENSQLKQQLLLEMWKKKNLHVSHTFCITAVLTYRSGFLKKDPNHSPNSHKKI